MYKITELKIENFRAFYGGPYVMSIPNGENVLVYGENGSGKSSLFLAIREWMRSGLQVWDGSKHVHHFASIGTLAKVSATLSDPSGAETKAATIPDVDEVAAHGHPSVTAAWNGHGWQTYRELLKSYFVDAGNIFHLLVIDVLGEIKPTGSEQTIREMWQAIETAKKTNAKSVSFKTVVNFTLGKFNDVVNTFIKRDLERLVNELLNQYFKLHVRVRFGEIDLHFKRLANGAYEVTRDFGKRNSEKNLGGDQLNIQVDLFEFPFEDHSNGLNEARLNAIALCMFLASRIMFPVHTQGSFRTLLLDDIFVGLDTSNRIPLLEILTAPEIKWEEQVAHGDGTTTTQLAVPRRLFGDYQIFLSTYDRHWFEFAKRWFETKQPGKWKTLEMYVHQGAHITGDPKTFDKPILLQDNQSDLEKGIAFLFHVERPDYPSAANCFRKAMEQVIGDGIPDWFFRTQDLERIEDHMLTLRANLTKSFLAEIDDPTQAIDDLIVSLPSLLHPLSHAQTSVTPYKGELTRVMEAIMLLKVQLATIRMQTNFRIVLEAGKKIRMRYTIEPNHYSFYMLRLEHSLFTFERNEAIKVSMPPCHYLECWGEKDGKEVAKSKNDLQKNKPKRFPSLEACYRGTHSSIVKFPGLEKTELEADYRKGFEIPNGKGQWIGLLDKLQPST
jgi:energy-coupling factor transporter ATP-binding protein EcfA2